MKQANERLAELFEDFAVSLREINADVQQEKYDGGARVEALVERGTNGFCAGHHPCV
jgi:hypothetical protein